jgi:hypothetical protein
MHVGANLNTQLVLHLFHNRGPANHSSHTISLSEVVRRWLPTLRLTSTSISLSSFLNLQRLIVSIPHNTYLT